MFRLVNVYPDTTNEATVTMHLPRANQLTVEALCSIMERVGAGVPP
jgi:hypothetical protein